MKIYCAECAHKQVKTSVVNSLKVYFELCELLIYIMSAKGAKRELRTTNTTLKSSPKHLIMACQ